MPVVYIRSQVRRSSGEREALFWQISFLTTFVLWMSGFYEATDGLGDILVEGFFAVIFTCFTFWIVAILLAFLLIPLRMLLNVLRALSR